MVFERVVVGESSKQYMMKYGTSSAIMASDSSRIVKIVNAVRKHDCLWDVNSNDYNKREKLDKAWSAVSQEVGKSDVFCRDKWRNVRTGFLRSIQHQIRRSDDENVPKDFHTVKRKRFYLYDQMSFLLPAAECLEIVRKKRRQSREPKVFNEAEGWLNQYCDNTNTAYSIVEKSEQSKDDVDSGDDYAEEHHTLGTINRCSDKDGSDEHQEAAHVNTTNENRDQARYESMRIQNVNCEQSAEENSTATGKIMHNTDKQTNEAHSPPEMGNNQEDSYFRLPTAGVTNNTLCGRDEEQLLYFFRGCIDDILTLDKRKQRQFKRRMLELISELHDLESTIKNYTHSQDATALTDLTTNLGALFIYT